MDYVEFYKISIQTNAAFYNLPDFLQDKLNNKGLNKLLPFTNNCVDFFNLREKLNNRSNDSFKYHVLTILSKVETEINLAKEIIQKSGIDGYKKYIKENP